MFINVKQWDPHSNQLSINAVMILPYTGVQIPVDMIYRRNPRGLGTEHFHRFFPKSPYIPLTKHSHEDTEFARWYLRI